MKKEKRFEVVHEEGLGLAKPQTVILRDKQTGALYLFVVSGYSGGLTPLLDIDGKPMIDESGI